ncbi:MAG: ribokinase [Algoriphagus sp.]|nr:ribokinase [Algoriphagus sp.]
MSKILVVGSSNTDMVVKSAHLPLPGETVLGGQFFTFAGGKGANQAVAAAKLGGDVTFLAKVGNDALGKIAVEGFKKEGIDVSHIITDPDSHSGVALIMVEDSGENCISVASGANGKFTALDIENASELVKKASYVLVQLEIPLEAVTALVDKAFALGVPVILNPAPARPLSDKLISKLFIITPNETEAELLTGVKVTDEVSAAKAAKILREKGAKLVIITLGAKGAFLLSDQEEILIPSIQVNAVDTTAAGDTFNGALTVALSEGMEIKAAIRFANQAAAISVTRMGAQSSQPVRSELKPI